MNSRSQKQQHARHLMFAFPILIGVLVVAPAIFSGHQSQAAPKAAAVANVKSCIECHDDTTLITGKATALARSVHGTGEAYERGTSASCAGCHSGGGFSKMVAAGLSPDQVAEGDPNPTRQDCRACHQVHVSYSSADWALETTAPVSLFASEGVTFEGGKGNLCANCHQARRIFPGDPDEDGIVTGISTHWGPHHGPQSQMLLGLAGAGPAGFASGHYYVVENTCVACHMGTNASHLFEPSVATCRTCHPGAPDFDINGRQSSTLAQLDDIGAELVALGYLSSNDEDGHPTVSSAPLNIAIALWNWLYVAHEDKSLGVHNPSYTQSLLDEAKAQLGI